MCQEVSRGGSFYLFIFFILFYLLVYVTDSREVELVADDLAAIVVVVNMVVTHRAVFSVVEDVDNAKSSV